MIESNFWLSKIDFIDYLLYAILLVVTGRVIFWLISADLNIRLTHYKYRLKLKKQQTLRREHIKKQSNWYRHLYQLMSIKSSDVDSSKIYGFVVAELILAVGVLIVMLIQIEDFVLALIIAFLATILPYLYLWVRARNVRIEIGNGIQEVVETLIHCYSATGGDMYTALNLTQSELKNAELKRVLTRLISDLQTVHKDDELREVIDLFIFTTGSSWGMRLGNIILKAYVYQENVMSALLTLQKQMINHQKMIEEEKAGALDVFSQAMLALILLPVSLIGAKYITRPQNWWVLQFGESWSVISFVITTLMVGVAAIVGFLVRNPKKDL